MTEHVSLWDDPGAQSSNQQASATVETTATNTGTESETASITTTTTTAQNPIAAAIDASAWEREDIELAISVAKLLLMAYFVYKYRQEGA